MKTSGSQKIAERYVSALFDVATQAKCVDDVEKDLRGLADIIKNNADFRAFLHNPLLTRDAQATVAQAVLAKIGAEKLTSQFIALLAHQKRLDVLPDMISLYLQYARVARGELAAKVISATPLSESEANSISEKLKKAFGKKIVLTVKEDPSLIAGVVLKVGSQQLDGSIAGKLNRLKMALKAA